MPVDYNIRLIIVLYASTLLQVTLKTDKTVVQYIPGLPHNEQRLVQNTACFSLTFKPDQSSKRSESS